MPINSDMQLNFAITGVSVLAIISEPFLFVYAFRKISNKQISFLTGIAWVILTTVISNMTQKTLIYIGDCGSFQSRFICRIIQYDSPWNFSPIFWQLPVFFLITVGIAKVKNISTNHFDSFNVSLILAIYARLAGCLIAILVYQKS